MIKNIMFLTLLSKGGGAERVMTHLSNYFSESRYNVCYASFNNNGYYFLNPQIERYVFSGKNKYQSIISLRRHIKQKKYDCIIAFGYPAAVRLAMATFGILAAPQLVMSERNDPARNINSKLKELLRIWAYGRARAIVFQTEDAKNYFPIRIRNKGKIIPNPIIFDDNFEADLRNKRIIASGRITAQKNFSILIRAFSIFSRIKTGYTLDIYGVDDGSGEWEKLQKLIADMELGETVSIKGFSDNIIDEYKRSCMYVSSSDYEGISNSMIEAMACGLPTICTDCPCGGARMMIKDRINGILVPVGDYDAMARSMILIVDNIDFALSLSHEAKKIVKDLSIEHIADIWLDVLN